MTAPDGWIPVRGYEGRYEVHPDGAVRSLERTVRKSNGTLAPVRGKTLVPSAGFRGHMRVRLVNRAGALWVSLSRTVCRAFHGEPPFPGAVAMHVRSDVTNNRSDNLKWGSTLENQRQRAADGTDNRGERNASAVLTSDDVTEIRRRRRNGEKLATLSADFRVSKTQISHVARGASWGHVREETVGTHDVHAGRKLHREQVEEIVRMRRGGSKLRDVAEKFGIVTSYVSKLEKQAGELP